MDVVDDPAISVAHQHHRLCGQAIDGAAIVGSRRPAFADDPGHVGDHRARAAGDFGLGRGGKGRVGREVVTAVTIEAIGTTGYWWTSPESADYEMLIFTTTKR